MVRLHETDNRHYAVNEDNNRHMDQSLGLDDKYESKFFLTELNPMTLRREMKEEHAPMPHHHHQQEGEEEEQQHPSLPFCDSARGGTIMYMDGFQFTLKPFAHTPSLLAATQTTVDHVVEKADMLQSSKEMKPCLNFLFLSFHLRTTERFMVAMMVTVCLGMMSEYLSIYRHQYSQQNHSSRNYAVKSAIMYGLQSFLSYILMLIIMSFSIELLVCVIVGHGIGFWIFSRSIRNPESVSGNTCHGLSQHEGDDLKAYFLVSDEEEHDHPISLTL